MKQEKRSPPAMKRQVEQDRVSPKPKKEMDSPTAMKQAKQEKGSPPDVEAPAATKTGGSNAAASTADSSTPKSSTAKPAARKFPVAEWNYQFRCAEIWVTGDPVRTSSLTMKDPHLKGHSKILATFPSLNGLVAEVAGAWWWMTEIVPGQITSTPVVRKQGASKGKLKTLRVKKLKAHDEPKWTGPLTVLLNLIFLRPAAASLAPLGHPPPTPSGRES